MSVVCFMSVQRPLNVHLAEREKGEWGWLRISGSTRQTETLRQGPSLITTSSVLMALRCKPTRPWRWRSSRGRLWQRSGSSSTGQYTEPVSNYSFQTQSWHCLNCSLFFQGGDWSRLRLLHHHPCPRMFRGQGAVSPAGADPLPGTTGPQHRGRIPDQLLSEEQQELVYRWQRLSDDREDVQEVH